MSLIKINHLLFMDDLKLFGKSYEQIASLVQTVHTFSIDIGMEFGIKKCGVLGQKRGKIANMEGVVLPDGQVVKEIEHRGYRYLGILETDHLKEKEMKDLFSKEYKRRLKLVLKSKLSGKNKIMAANTWAVAILRYSAGVVEWKTDELKVLDRKTGKMMILYGVLHPKSDVHRVYLPRQRGGRGLISCEMCVETEENNLTWYVRNSNQRLMVGVRKIKILDSEGAKERNEYERDRRNVILNRWKEKKKVWSISAGNASDS